MAKYKAVKDPKYIYVYHVYVLRRFLWFTWWGKFKGKYFSWGKSHTLSLESTLLLCITPIESKVVEL